MTKKRSPSFSLDEALTDPGFTPRPEDVPGLMERLGQEDGERSLAALRRIEASVIDRFEARFAVATNTKEKAVSLRAIGDRLPREPETQVRSFCVSALGDAEPRVRRAAARALGKIGKARDALSRAMEVEVDPRVREQIADALGKHGVVVETSSDRTRLIATREAARKDALAFDDARPLPTAAMIDLRCRPGLERMLGEEVKRRLHVEPFVRRGGARFPFAGTLGEIGRVRAASRLGFFVGSERASYEDQMVTSATNLLTGDRARQVFEALGAAPHRYRIAWGDEKKRRGATMQIAARAGEEGARQKLDLVNDPRASDWVAHFEEHEGEVSLTLEPGWTDERFAYRVAEVPAASHPTIASALVTAAGITRDDVVWDPFVGSGLELCERHLAGRYKLLLGTDTDPRALEAAKANLESVAKSPLSKEPVQYQLIERDARTFDPRGVTVVITNPPMGRRLVRSLDLEQILVDVMVRCAGAMPKGGRLVWLSPKPERTRTEGARLGLSLARQATVEMGGFEAELQMFTKR